MSSHEPIIVRRPRDCSSPNCTTKYDVVCVCGWAQGAASPKHGFLILLAHKEQPNWDMYKVPVP